MLLYEIKINRLEQHAHRYVEKVLEATVHQMSSCVREGKGKVQGEKTHMEIDNK